MISATTKSFIHVSSCKYLHFRRGKVDAKGLLYNLVQILRKPLLTVLVLLTNSVTSLSVSHISPFIRSVRQLQHNIYGVYLSECFLLGLVPYVAYHFMLRQ